MSFHTSIYFVNVLILNSKAVVERRGFRPKIFDDIALRDYIRKRVSLRNPFSGDEKFVETTLVGSRRWGFWQVIKKVQRAKIIKMNVSFDSNDADKENDYSSDNSINIVSERRTATNKREVLGSFIKDKNKEHLINAILRQADREDLMKTLGFPNRKNWIKRNIPIWFASGGILAE